MGLRSVIVLGAVGGVLLGTAIGHASASGSYFLDEGFYVNENSFIPEGLESDVSRLAQYSAQIWARAGASRYHLKFLGLGNSMTGCGIGVPNHVFANAGCDPSDAIACSSGASYNAPYPDCFYAWNITVWLQSSDFRMEVNSSVARPGQTLPDGGPAKVANLGFVLEHEFGHRFTAACPYGDCGHVPDEDPNPHADPNRCIMNAALGTVDGTKIVDNPCNPEIESMATSFGHPRDIVRQMGSTTFPIPNGGTWQSPSQVATKYGVGFGTPVPGTVANFAYADSSVSPHQVKTLTYTRGNPYGTEVAAPIYTNRAPAVAYDGAIWWYFAADPSDGKTVNVYSTPNNAAFTYQGKVKDLGLDAYIKSPPAVSYDPRSGRVLVIWSTPLGDLAPNPTCNGTTAGCVNELRMSSFHKNSSAPLAWLGSFPFRPPPGTDRGFSALGTPSIACDSSTYPNDGNCLVVMTGRNPGRNLFSFTFKVSTVDASVEFLSSLHSFAGSAIGMTPSVAVSNPLSVSASFVFAARGEDSVVYINTRANLGSAWSGWSSIPSLSTHYNPVVISRGSSYDLLVAP